MAYAGSRPRAPSHRATRALLLPHGRRVRTGDEWRGRADADADADERAQQTPPLDSDPVRAASIASLLIGIALVLTAPGAAGREAAPVGASVFISPSGSDRNACTRRAPCESFMRGYQAAKPGHTVAVAGGRYDGQQEIPVDRSKVSPKDVVFRPANSAAAVVLESLDVYGKHVEVRNVRIERDFYVKCGADDVTLRNSKATLFFVRPATNVRIIRSEFGPSDTISQMGSSSDCPTAPNRVLLDGVYMHDFTHPVDSKHMECLTVEAADNLTIRNSRFYHCEDFDILFKHRGAVLASRNILIENNWFDKPWPDGTSAIQFSEPDGGGTFSNVLIRNNSLAGTLLLKPNVGYRNTRVLSNVGNRYGGPCSGGDVEVAYNVWSDGGCGATNRRAASGFRSPERFDFHLKPGAAAVNRGHPTSYPRGDIDGQRRPRGQRPDAGADEAG
jgi:hypothetical protein